MYLQICVFATAIENSAKAYLLEDDLSFRKSVDDLPQAPIIVSMLLKLLLVFI